MKKKDELLFDCIVNAIEFIVMVIGMGCSLVACNTADDFAALYIGGIVYVIPCIAECAKYILIEYKDFTNRLPKKICMCILLIDIAYVIFNGIFMGTANPILVDVLIGCSIFVMALYPIKAAYFAYFYYEEYEK